MRRVMVPQNLLVWAEVDLDSRTVVDVWASDLIENYTLDKHPDDGKTHCLYVLDDWGDDVSDPVSEPEASEAIAVTDEVDWPKLRLEEAYRASR